MGHLIILRGPAGSGKSTVCDYLREELGRDSTCSLDLDITTPDEDKFNKNIERCLSYENVIGMMYYGNSHTDNPKGWIIRFKTRGYNILSVILYASMDECYERCKNDKNPERVSINKSKEYCKNDKNPERVSINKSKEYCNKYWIEFYEREEKNVFHQAAGINGITIMTENKSQSQVGDEILSNMMDDSE